MKRGVLAKGLAVLLGLELAFSTGISSPLPVYGAEPNGELAPVGVGTYGVNLSSAGYSSINPFPNGECTWYVWGRAYEKLGVSLPWGGNATDWTGNAAAYGYSTGGEARTNCIMVEHYSPYGHVFFVERVENGIAYVTEGNYNGSYHEDAINLSTMKRSGWSSSMNPVDYIYITSSNPSVSFAPWENGNFTYIGTRDASIGQEINVSSGTCTETGMYLFDESGNTLAWAKNPSYTLAKVYFKINEECGYTLTPGTIYKYKFYAIVNGSTYWGNEGSFITFGEEMSSGAGYTIPNGDYEIVSLLSDKTYQLDIAGDAVPAANTENVSFWPRSDEPRVQDVFTVTYLNNGFYSIKQKGTNMSLDIDGAGRHSQCNLRMVEENGSSAQQFSISFDQFGGARQGYRIQPKCSGMAIDVCGGKAEPGANVNQHPNHHGGNQGWLFIPYQPSKPIENGRYILFSQAGKTDEKKLEVDVEGDGIATGKPTNIQNWKDDECLGRYNSFDVKALPNGYYELINHASGLALDLDASKSSEFANIQLHSVNGSDAQKWAITKEGDGYILRPRCSGLVMDLKAGAKDNGTNIEQYPYGGGVNQTWYFVQAEHKISFNANGGTGAPASQTKYYKEPLEISSTVPVKEGSEFKYWSYSDNDYSVQVKAGGTLKDPLPDKDITLKANWEEKPTVISVKDVMLPSKKTVKKGETITLTPVISPSNATNQTVAWRSLNDGVATVDPNGAVTGIKAGTASIIVKTNDGGFEATCLVEVTEETSVIHVSDISLPSKRSVKKGESIVLTPTITPDNASNQNVSWRSSNNKIATVDGDGVVTGVVKGEVTITVRTDDGGYEATCLLEVVDITEAVPVTGVFLPAKSNVVKGNAITLTPVIIPENATIRTVTWKSSNDKIAAVDAEGVVTGIKVGKATITVTSDDGGFEDTCLVEVTDASNPDNPDNPDNPSPEEPDSPVNPINLEENLKTDYTLIPGEVRRLNVNTTGQYGYGIKWSIQSAYPKGCVTVKNGVATAKKAGRAIVTAVYGESSITFHVTVDGTVPERKIVYVGGKAGKLSATKTVKANVGEGTRKATVSITSNLASSSRNLSYEVKEPGICEVRGPYFNNSGSKASFEIVPREAGATYIVWSIKDGTGSEATAFTKVLVKKPVTNLSISQGSDITLKPGEGRRLTVLETKDNTDAKDLSFSVQGSGIKVSKSGYVVGTAQYGGGMVIVRSGKAYASVRVSLSGNAGDYLTINKPSVTISTPKSGTKTASLKVLNPMNKADHPNVTWTVLGSPKGIYIGGNGVISVSSGATPGCYVVTAAPVNKSGSGSAAYCELIVK